MHPVLKLIAKVLLWFFPLIILFAVYFVRSHSAAELQHATLEDKVTHLVSASDPRVIIAGDSRAEQNVVPDIFTAETKFSSANIGIGAGTISMVYDVLHEHSLLGGKRLIVISVSSYEINDSFFDDHSKDAAIVSAEPWGARKLRYLGMYAYENTLYYIDHFKKFLRGNAQDDGRIDAPTLASKGYVANQFVFQPPPPGTPREEEPWYMDVKTGGINEKSFLQGIEEFGASGDTIVIYLGPIAPSWRQSLTGTDASTTEAHFIDVITKAIQPYPNMHFIDFRAHDIPQLTDDKFTDGRVHLNYNGAPIFTELLVETLRERHLIK